MEDFPKEQIELVQDIYDMRWAQHEYFRQPTSYRLKVAKAKEAKVDKYLEYFICKNLIDTRGTLEKPKDTQASLFND